MTALRAPLALLLCLTSVPAAAQQPPDTSSSAGRLEVTPARLELAVGDSLRLSAQAFDASGKPIPDATIFFRPKASPPPRSTPPAWSAPAASATSSSS